jgi:glycosyltransferase involved in cell wall biosynthesis
VSDRPPIYVAAGDTARNPFRSGIQTTVRRLVAELGSSHAARARVAYWNRHMSALHSLPRKFSLGLAAEPLRRAPSLSLTQKLTAIPGWFPGRQDDRIPLHRHPLHRGALRGAWLLLPELLYGHRRTERFIAYARRHGMRIAAIFYDAIPVQHPEFSPPGLTDRHLGYMRELSKIDLLLPISETAAGAWHNVMEREGLLSPAVKILPLAAEFTGAPRPLKPRLAQMGAVRALCLSTVEPRKNHRSLCAALETIADAGGTLPFELDLVGARDPAADDLAETVAEVVGRFADQVRWHDAVDSSTLRRFFDQCDFTVYPSVVEGFGLPILESLWLARPCVCANFGVMAEHARGGGCLTVDVRDPAALAAATRQLATDSSLRHRLAHEAIRRPLKTWREYADDIVRALDDA